MLESGYLYIVGAFVIGLALGAFAAYVLLMKSAIGRKTQEDADREALEKAGELLDIRFKASAQEAMQNNNKQFLLLAEESLKGAQADSAHDLDKRQKAIDEMVKPVRENLKSMSAALEQVKGTDKALREDLNNLNRETAKLVGALRDPSAQGTWGEFILEGVLDKSGLIKGLHYDTQVSFESESGRQRPDAIIHMQDGFNIIIDAKAPINKFTQRLSEDISEDEHTSIMKNLAGQVRDHVKKLGAKNYWENVDSPDFTVLFLPSEHIYSIALRADTQLVDYAASQNVIIASPTLLMSLLRVVGLSWRQIELAQNAQEIADIGYDLYKRFLVFTSHLEKIGSNLQNAMKGYDLAVGSLKSKVLPAARKFKELQSAKTGIEDLPSFEEIEALPRQISLTAEDEQEKKRA